MSWSTRARSPRHHRLPNILDNYAGDVGLPLVVVHKPVAQPLNHVVDTSRSWPQHDYSSRIDSCDLIEQGLVERQNRPCVPDARVESYMRVEGAATRTASAPPSTACWIKPSIRRRSAGVSSPPPLPRRRDDHRQVSATDPRNVSANAIRAGGIAVGVAWMSATLGESFSISLTTVLARKAARTTGCVPVGSPAEQSRRHRRIGEVPTRVIRFRAALSESPTSLRLLETLESRPRLTNFSLDRT